MSSSKEEKWLKSLGEISKSSVPLTKHTDEAKSELKYRTLDISLVGPEWPVPKGLEKASTKDLSYSVSVRFFHALSQTFYANVFSGEWHDRKGEDMELDEIVYWCSRQKEKDMYIVVELVATQIIPKRNELESPRYACGWTYFKVESKEDSKKMVPIYEGTPRKLLYVGRSVALEACRSTFLKSGINMQFESTSFSPMRKVDSCRENDPCAPELGYAKEDFLIGAKELIPCIAFDPRKNDLDYSKTHEINVTNLSIAFQTSSRDDFEKDVINAVIGGDKGSSVGKKKSTFLQFSKRPKKKDLKPKDICVVNRRIRLGIHNTHAWIESKTVDLQIDENDDLISDESIRLDCCSAHASCAVVFSLEYTLNLHLGTETATDVQQPSQNTNVLVAAQILIPFHEGQKYDGKEEVMELTLACDGRYNEAIAFSTELHRPFSHLTHPLNEIKVKFKQSIEPTTTRDIIEESNKDLLEALSNEINVDTVSPSVRNKDVKNIKDTSSVPKEEKNQNDEHALEESKLYLPIKDDNILDQTLDPNSQTLSESKNTSMKTLQPTDAKSRREISHDAAILHHSNISSHEAQTIERVVNIDKGEDLKNTDERKEDFVPVSTRSTNTTLLRKPGVTNKGTNTEYNRQSLDNGDPENSTQISPKSPTFQCQSNALSKAAQRSDDTGVLAKKTVGCKVISSDNSITFQGKHKVRKMARILKDTDTDLRAFITDAQVIVRSKDEEKLKMHPQSHRLSFFLKLLEHTYETDHCREEQIENLISDHYRREHQIEFIQKHIAKLNLKKSDSK